MKSLLGSKCSVLLAVLALALCMLTACGKEPASKYRVYYLSIDKSQMVPVSYSFKTFDPQDMIAEALQVLETDVDSVEYMKPIPSEVSVLDYNLSSDGILSVYFSKDYLELSPLTEILVRSAVVHTMVQLEDVKAVMFYVSNSPLTDSTGAIVGAMTAESFIDDFGQETESLLSTQLELYFASADGTSLVKEQREVYYSRNVTKERLIVDQLLKGPENAKLLKSIPLETKVINVSVTDGVCFVNFDSGFETTLAGVTDNATVYSIVNSLTSLDNITAVQILVNGDTPHLINKDYDMSGQFTFNSEITIDIEDDEEEELSEWSDSIIGPDLKEENNKK